MARVLIGTSGWHYDSWRGPFYPAGLPQTRSFNTTPANSTALNSMEYSTERRRRMQLETGGSRPGNDFTFAWKASKFITHWKRLSANSANSLDLMENRLSLLGAKAGPVLFQLPPNFQADGDRLSAFLQMLPRGRRFSFEFRHPSWYAPRIMRLLANENISLCISVHHDAPAPWKRTAEFVYVRGHGPGGRYKGHYALSALTFWAKRIRSWRSQGCDVFVFFDNDQKSAAPIDALKLKQVLRLPPHR